MSVCFGLSETTTFFLDGGNDMKFWNGAAYMMLIESDCMQRDMMWLNDPAKALATCDQFTMASSARRQLIWGIA